MKVFARADLIPAHLAPHEPALLCEGSWPAPLQSAARFSLDDAIDARFAWIDREASRLAECAAEAHGQDSSALFAWLNALALRYELVKYIRVIAFFEQCYRPHRREPLELHLARGRDETYATLFREVSRSYRLARVERWHDASSAESLAFPANRAWRRGIARLAQRNTADPTLPASDRPRVVLCGNPRVLDPVCHELLARGVQVWWLYDRFAVRGFARWRMRGVRQLVCDSDLGTANVFAELKLTARLACRGIDLGHTIERWLADRAQAYGPRHTRLLAEAERQLRAIQPDALLCDEDATPLPRVAIQVTRTFGTQSYVVQHGAPCIRFGFAPPAADRLLVWGESSQRQLARWGVTRDRISITGATMVSTTALSERTCKPTADGVEKPASQKHVVLLATVPPSDRRPDAVEYHLTSKTHRDMLMTACQAVSRLPQARLTIKLHPRTRDTSSFTSVLASFPGLKATVLRGGNLARLVDRADVVLSCASSAGVEAAARGVPVIQLLPSGSIDLLANDAWGFVGTARGGAELEALLEQAFSGASTSPAAPVFAAGGQAAARRIAEVVLDRVSVPVAVRHETTIATDELTLAGASPWPLS
ncbi:MAG: hypothetical protein KF708_04580 [Pirellulales bacterium]|nr:hypothetical protein [Pirellulales bacterium]